MWAFSHLQLPGKDNHCPLFRDILPIHPRERISDLFYQTDSYYSLMKTVDGFWFNAFVFEISRGRYINLGGKMQKNISSPKTQNKLFSEYSSPYSTKYCQKLNSTSLHSVSKCRTPSVILISWYIDLESCPWVWFALSVRIFLSPITDKDFKIIGVNAVTPIKFVWH